MFFLVLIEEISFIYSFIIVVLRFESRKYAVSRKECKAHFRLSITLIENLMILLYYLFYLLIHQSSASCLFLFGLERFKSWDIH